ncbi:glycerate kinase [Lactobacillus sp. LL6]|uniref:glycerate kinase family protein n=1 Tax=Lactobacillus sp. LL6 TaxID=2596827 RepID=UPI0011853F9D|nr:glycerate kinase [Lactobacillus sp. LL6]TSO26073.1 glycerate kinase [Lactobacillus sp. LL6]
MKFVLAPDSFKESMTAKEVCLAMASGIKKVIPDAKIIPIPMADGGEGTMTSLVDATKGNYIQKTVTGPLNEPAKASYGLLGDGSTAIIEMAEASGISYLKQNQKTPVNILKTTTYGTGELILDALKHNVTKIIIGLGGSATNDGGSGMAEALGVRFFDKNGQIISKLSGGKLNKITNIDISQLDARVKNCQIILASDVTNPLIGPKGASYVFGKQKGADASTQKLLDSNLTHYANIIKKVLNKDISSIPGSGAAGGLGGGLLAFTNSKIHSGVEIVAQETHLEEAIKNADYVFTGEGGTDFQTKYGKTPYGVAKIAKKYDVPVISLAGYLGTGIEQLYQYGFTAIFGILDKATTLDEALKNGPKNVTRTTENITRLLITK